MLLFHKIPFPFKDLKTYKVFNRTFYDKITFSSTKTYRQRNCFDMCYHSAVLKQCNCATNIFKEENYESCSNATNKCKNQVSDVFYIQAKINDLEELKKSILQKAFSGELTNIKSNHQDNLRLINRHLN